MSVRGSVEERVGISIEELLVVLALLVAGIAVWSALPGQAQTIGAAALEVSVA